MKLTNEDVQEILRLIDASPIGELHVETDGFRLHLRRGGDGQWMQSSEVKPKRDEGQRHERTPSPTLPFSGGGRQETTPADAKARRPGTAESGLPLAGGGRGNATPAAAASTRKLADVLTPLPGTFYRSPQPGAPSFVEIGSAVEENTVVCIVETMKLMNSIHAGVRGKVAEICVDNDRPVEQNAVLMRIEPAK